MHTVIHLCDHVWYLWYSFFPEMGGLWFPSLMFWCAKEILEDYFTRLENIMMLAFNYLWSECWEFSHNRKTASVRFQRTSTSSSLSWKYNWDPKHLLPFRSEGRICAASCLPRNVAQWTCNCVYFTKSEAASMVIFSTTQYGITICLHQLNLS